MAYFKFVLSFSLLCAFFSLLPLLHHLHSLNLKPLFPMQFFGYTVDKSYIFLLCNSLLVFIAINSAPTTDQTIEFADHSHKTSHSEFNVSYNNIVAPINQSSPNIEKIICHSEFNASYNIAAPIADDNSVETEFPEEEESLVTLEADNVLSDTEEDEEEDENSVETEFPEEEKEEEEESLVTLEADNVLSDTEEDEEEDENSLMIIVEDEHEECAHEMEELNKKCEEFIRKMKAAFRANSR